MATGGQVANTDSTLTQTPAQGRLPQFSAAIKLDRFTKLTGAADFQVWRETSTYVFTTYGCLSIVEETETRPIDTTGEKQQIYDVDPD